MFGRGFAYCVVLLGISCVTVGVVKSATIKEATVRYSVKCGELVVKRSLFCCDVFP